MLQRLKPTELKSDKLMKMKWTAIAAVFLLLLSSCKNDKDLVEVPPPDNPPEVITSIELTLTDSANPSSPMVVAFRDPDGAGGADPTQMDDISLAANSTYFVSVALWNESDPDDVEDIGAEVLEESNDHLMCYVAEDVDLAVEITDTDGNNLPLGLMSTWRTGSAGSGAVEVILKHQPGVKDGTCGPGDTDVEVDFNCTIQ